MPSYNSNINTSYLNNNLINTYATNNYEKETNIQAEYGGTEAAAAELSNSGQVRRYVKSINNTYGASGGSSQQSMAEGRGELKRLVMSYRSLAIRAANEENTEMEDVRLHREMSRVAYKLNETADKIKLNDIKNAKEKIVEMQNEYEEKKARAIEENMAREMMNETKKAMLLGAKSSMRAQANQSPNKVLSLV